MLTNNLRVACATGLFSLLLLGSLHAKEPATGGTTQPAGHRLVLRLSDEYLNSIMNDKDVDREANVQEVILGTTNYGKARVLGKPGVKLLESEREAKFLITLTGTVHSRTTGYNGPAIIRSRSETKFNAVKEVVFDPEKGFYGKPSNVSAKTVTTIEDIGSTRGGLVGRVVSRRARQIEAGLHDQAQEIARQKAEQRIEAAFDKSSAERLARLNQVAELRRLASTALRGPGDGEPGYDSCTTTHYLQIATRFGERTEVLELPVDAEGRGAPIELWVHDSLFASPLGQRLENLGSAKAEASSNSLTAAARQLGTVIDPFASLRLLLGSQFQVRQVEDWRVVKMDGLPLTRSVAAPTERRATARQR